MTKRFSLTEHEQQQRIIELIIASTPNADFQKELLRKDKTLTLEETVSIGKIYEASNIHIKQLRAMRNNNNNVDNTNIQAIRMTTRSICQIIVSNVVKAMLFTMKLAQHSDQNATHGVKQTTEHQYICQTEQNQNKDWGHKAENTKKRSHYQPQYRRKQYVKTGAVYNNREAEEQMESLTFNCINMTQRDEAFVLINIKLPNQNGIHKLRLKIDTGAQGNTLPISTFRRMFPEKLNADGFPNIKNKLSTKKTDSL